MDTLSSLPVGIEKSGGGTNHPGRPTQEGQLGVFVSPYANNVVLVDVGELDRYGSLRWTALSDADPRYRQAIDAVERPGSMALDT